jgi:hypothetical protein
LLIAFIGTSCSKDDDTVVVEEKGTIDINFNFYVNGEPLEIGTKTYAIDSGDTIGIDDFKFILSNLVLNGDSKWTEEDSYRLIKGNSTGNFTFEVKDVSKANYSRIEFLIGVDSSMNFKPENFPILFQTEGMYWEWNTGYKFLLLEGTYNSATPGIIWHMGGMNILKKLTFDLNRTINLNGEQIEFDIELAEIFSGPNKIDLTIPNNRNVVGGGISSEIAENYSNGMIKLTPTL